MSIAATLGTDERAVGQAVPMDVAFIGSTAYVLVAAVGADVGGTDVVGIYRIDSADHFTVIADIVAFATANPPSRCPPASSTPCKNTGTDSWSPTATTTAGIASAWTAGSVS